jgi:hypothetical protein
MFPRALAPLVLLVASAACATSGGVPRPFPSAERHAPPPPNSTPPAPAGAIEDHVVSSPLPETEPPARSASLAPSSLTERRYDGRAVAHYALGFRGVPYRLGGTDPSGFDCSGLVQFVFAQYGITVPRVVEQQFEVGDKIRPADLKPGDLIFFNTQGKQASHVAIALGQEQFVHAPNSTGVVRVESLSSTYWGSRYLGARRVMSSMVAVAAIEPPGPAKAGPYVEAPRSEPPVRRPESRPVPSPFPGHVVSN